MPSAYTDFGEIQSDYDARAWGDSMTLASKSFVRGLRRNRISPRCMIRAGLFPNHANSLKTVCGVALAANGCNWSVCRLPMGEGVVATTVFSKDRVCRRHLRSECTTNR